VLLIALMAAPQLLFGAVQPELPNPGDTGISKQEQEQVGAKAVGEVYQQFPILPDSSLETRYVQSLGQKLAAVIPAEYSWPYQFHVVQQKDINAFALPGGPIFVNVGTILAADNEAELAGVIAHEMSHVYMQHSVKQMKQNMGPSVLAGLGQILGQMIGGVGGAIASLGGQLSGGLLSMKYSRKDEAQADSVGAIILYKAGYNPKAMADFFTKLEQQGGGAGPQFMSDHPNPGNREAAIQKEIAEWPAKKWQRDSSQFQQARNDARSVKVYTAQQIQQCAKSGGSGCWRNQPPANVPVSAQQGGAAPGGTAPAMSRLPVEVSNNYRRFDGNGFAIEYPENWQPYPDQSGTAVTIAPQGGLSQDAIAYGVLLNQAAAQNAGSLDQATQQLINSIRQQNPDLRANGNPQAITVNGVRGQSVDLIGNSPVQENGRPLQERDWLVTMPHSNGSLLYVVFIAPERDFGKLRPAFQHMLRSLQLQ
jgi:hypothetical protein